MRRLETSPVCSSRGSLGRAWVRFSNGYHVWDIHNGAAMTNALLQAAGLTLLSVALCACGKSEAPSTDQTRAKTEP